MIWGIRFQEVRNDSIERISPAMEALAVNGKNLWSELDLRLDLMENR